MKRVVAVLAALMIILVVAVAAPIQASSRAPEHFVTPADVSFTWSDGFGGWIDDACSSNYKDWYAILWQDTNLTGYHTKVCSWQPAFCDIPVPKFGSTVCAVLPTTGKNFNDFMSSIQTYIANPNVHCISVYSAANYYGDHWRLAPITAYAFNMGNTDVGNDRASSLKVTDPANGCTN